MIKTLPSNAESEGSIPGQETKGLQAAGCGKKKKKLFFKKNSGCVMGVVKNIHSLIYKNILYAVLFSGDSVYNC